MSETCTPAELQAVFLSRDLADGELGKRGQMELLALLDEAPDLEGAREVVRTLVGAVSPLDAAQARRLARVLARAGAQEEAVRLYRWCATRAGENVRFSFSPFEEQGSTVTVTPTWWVPGVSLPTTPVS